MPRASSGRGSSVQRAAAAPELARLAGDAGARDLLGLHGVRLLPVDDPGVLADVDLPDDLSPGA